VVACTLERQGIAGVPENPTKGQKVKSDSIDTRSDAADQGNRLNWPERASCTAGKKAS